jgi:ATP-dependent DNA helicase RecQ
MNAQQTTPANLEQALKHFFGYDAFRPGQRSIVETALQNRDLLVIMPTGGGKSLCFQLPALLKAGVTIVVSPLIALMQDQVEALQDNGIGATFLNSSLNAAEVRQRQADILAGKIKLLYVAPERLLSDRFLEWLDRLHESIGLSTLAIDEAHCVSEWGHDFRPEYRQMQQIRQRYPNVPVLALTATATERVRADIVQQLALRQPTIHVASFNRQNLYYEVRPKDKQSYQELLQQIRQTPGSGIIYCLSRRKVDELTYKLQLDGIAALPYHAGLSDRDRATNQTRFIRDDVRVMVATIAFGMGINKPDVRFVVHYDLPRNLESYYQESGRAGRDGEPAHCTLYFSLGDIKTIEYLIAQKVNPTTGAPLAAEQQIARQQLRQVIDFADSVECRRKIQLRYFGEAIDGNCANCDNCCLPKPVEDWTIEAQKFLSCIARCQENFGLKYIVDVLRGSKDKRILQNRHDQLSTYGIGRDRTADAWRRVGRSLLHQGLLDETTDGYPVLKLNALSWEVLRKQRSVLIALPNQPIDDSAQEEPASQAEAELLFDRLRQLRKQIADEQGMPPYMIFADSSLKAMAQTRPQTRSTFAKVSGVGSHKLERYGDRFTAAIRAFCEEQGLPLQAVEEPASAAVPTAAPTSSAIAMTHLTTLDLHQQGLSPSQIATERNLRLSTILDHLGLLRAAGHPVDLDALVPIDRQIQIRAAIEAVGPDSLRTIRDRLGESFDYSEIRLVRADWVRLAEHA